MRRQLSTRAEYFNIIGSSKQMQTIYETIESVAKSDANVLIVGESGTGKGIDRERHSLQFAAREETIHQSKLRGAAERMIESELFGHAKGAFTGAHSRQGRSRSSTRPAVR
jgi:transcriptional regulator with GAF, ATPase, and Fis domain